MAGTASTNMSTLGPVMENQNDLRGNTEEASAAMGFI